MPNPTKLHLVQGGVENGDLADLIEVAGSKRSRVPKWVVPKDAEPYESVCIFIRSHGLFATGVIDSNPLPSSARKNRYVAAIDGIQLIEPPISIETVVKQLPDLGWARYPRSITTVTDGTALKLLRLIEKRRATGHPDLDLKSLETASLEELRAVALLRAKSSLTPRARIQLGRARSAAIRCYALKRAGGQCEACKCEAPFRTAKNEPFLEVHHLFRVADGGPDHPEKVIAVCPNCHREAHYSHDSKTVNASMHVQVEEIEAQFRPLKS